MVYLSYMLSELRRRKGRTFLTALGLGVGVALVIVVSGLSAGLDNAQAKVLKPLTGVGTDMSVTRPIFVGSSSSSSSGNSGPLQLSAKERAELQKENGQQRIGFGNLKPGQKFTSTSFRSSQLSFASSEVTKLSSLSGVSSAAGGLTLSLTTVSGTVPQQSQTGGGFPGGGGGGGFNGPRSIDFSSIAVAGVDQTKPAVAAITPGQLTKGSYFSGGTSRQAIVNVDYAQSNQLTVGSTLKLASRPMPFGNFCRNSSAD